MSAAFNIALPREPLPHPPGTRIPPSPKATMIIIEGNPVWITETRARTRDSREGWIEERTDND